MLLLALIWLRGEREPLLAFVLYGPRALLALPLLVSVPALLAAAAPRDLWTQAVCVALVLWPVMGFRWNGRRETSRNSPTIRLLTYNVWLGYGDLGAIRRQLQIASPDVVIFQVASRSTEAIFDDPSFRGWHRLRNERFSICSRFPITAATIAEGLSTDNGPPFVRYTLETPLGPVDLFNVHLVSPRLALDELRKLVRRHPWRLFSAAARKIVENDYAVRERQARGLAVMVGQSSHPVLIAGDTNLPGLSLILRQHLADFRDAFEESGQGFGYTFPSVAPGPWMRLDRVLAGPELRFLGLREGERAGSDHLAVLVEIARAKGAPNVAR